MAFFGGKWKNAKKAQPVPYALGAILRNLYAVFNGDEMSLRFFVVTPELFGSVSILSDIRDSVTRCQFSEDLKSKISTFCMRADGFHTFGCLFVKKIKIKVLAVSMKPFY